MLAETPFDKPFVLVGNAKDEKRNTSRRSK
jgi:hypothetical protein